MPPAQKPPTPAEANLAEAQHLLQLWVKMKAYLAKAETQEPLSREDEQGFLDTKSEISRAQRSVYSKLPLGVNFAADRLQEILRQAISLTSIRALPKNDRAVFMGLWHSVFIYLSQTVGAFQFVAEGYVPPPRTVKAGTGIKDMKGAAGAKVEKKKKSVLKSPLAWIVFMGAAAAAFYLFGDQ